VGGLPLRRTYALLATVVVIGLGAGLGALAPASSGQATGTQPPACRGPARPPRLPLAARLSIYATPNPLTAGREVRVFGQLVGIRRGVPRCGITIVLWRRFPGQRRFSPVARTRTVAGGRYSFALPAGSVTTNRACSVGWAAAGSRSRDRA
jgi:hypothetical protein